MANLTTDADVKIIRTPRTANRPYFSMARSSAQDSRLTWEARGMLTYLLSKPDDWRVNIKDLMQNCGRDKVYNTLGELLDYKYLARYAILNAQGQRIGVEYDVFETPFTDLPDTVLPYPANQDITYKRVLQNRDLAPDGAAPVSGKKSRKTRAPKTSQWSKEKKDSVFDMIARQSFGIAIGSNPDAQGDPTWGGRIGKIIKGLQAFEKSISAEIDAGIISLFYQWYLVSDETAELSPPRDDTKFMEYFAQFWSQKTARDSGETPARKHAQFVPQKTSTEVDPEKLAQLQAEARRKLQELQS